MFTIPKYIKNQISKIKESKIFTIFLENSYKILNYYTKLCLKYILQTSLLQKLEKKFAKNSNMYKRIISSFIMLSLFLILFLINSLFLYIIAVIIIFIIAWFEWKSIVRLKYVATDNQYQKWLIIGIIYLALPFLSLMLLIQLEASAYLLYFMSLTVIITDISAYIFGKKYGKKKIMPSLSPNKTIVGSIAAIISCFIFGILFSIIILGNNLFYFHVTGIIAVIISIASQIGDFFESGIKRNFGVKDSSNLIPGHGGILDRIDGFLFAIPITFILNQTIV